MKGDLKESQDILLENIQHVVKNVREESFPRNVTPTCSRCDYYMECSPNGNISISLPGQIPDSIETFKKTDIEFEQLKFKFRYKKNTKKE